MKPPIMSKARTPENKPEKVVCNAFEVTWNEANDPEKWLEHLRKQGAYNEKCRCTKTGGERETRLKFLYIRIRTTEKTEREREGEEQGEEQGERERGRGSVILKYNY